MRTQGGHRFEAPRFELGTLPAGNLYSSVDDCANFLIALLNEGRFEDRTILPPDVLKLMCAKGSRSRIDGAQDYGIGFRVGELEGHRIVGHGGAVYGFSTQLSAVPEQRIGVVTVASLDASNGFTQRLADVTLRMLLAQKAGKDLPEIHSTSAVPNELAQQLEGRFASGNEIAALVRSGEKLLLRYKYGIYELRMLDGDLIVDDVAAYGQRITIKTSDELLFNGEAWTRLEDYASDKSPEHWKGIVGEYGWDHNVLFIFEDRGQLYALIEWFYCYPLTELERNRFAFPNAGLYPGEQLIFDRSDDEPATSVVAASVKFDRRNGKTQGAELYQASSQ